MPQKLTWHDVQDIGIALHEKFPDTDPLSVRFTDLHRWVRRAAGLLRRPEQVEREDPGSDPDGLARRARRVKPPPPGRR